MRVIEAGCARVEGDEEEDDIDDLENEFNFDATKSRKDMQHPLASDAMLHYGHTYDNSDPHQVLHPLPRLPLLTDGRTVTPFFPLLTLFTLLYALQYFRCPLTFAAS